MEERAFRPALRGKADLRGAEAPLFHGPPCCGSGSFSAGGRNSHPFRRDPGAYHTGFSIHVSRNLGQGKSSYSLEEIDFIAAFVAPYDTWYLIPVDALGEHKNIRLYPGNKSLKRRGGFYEQYREAWHLLKQET